MKQFPDERDIERFIAFAKPIMEEEKKRMIAFSKKKLNQIEDINESKEQEEKRKRKTNLLKNNSLNNFEK